MLILELSGPKTGRSKMPYGLNLVSHSSCSGAVGENENPDMTNLSGISGVTHVPISLLDFISWLSQMSLRIRNSTDVDFAEQREKCRQKDLGRWRDYAGRRRSLHARCAPFLMLCLYRSYICSPNPVLKGLNPAGFFVLPGRKQFHLRFHSAW